MWFSQWETDLVDLGFAHWQQKRSVIIPPKQLLGRIINIDETALSLDGANGCSGGRPRVEFYISSTYQQCHIEEHSSQAPQSPDHWILSSWRSYCKAKPGNEKLNIDILAKMKTVEDLFGKWKLTKFPTTTYRMNEKRGMKNEIEFEKYVKDNLMRLYLDAADLPGKRVMIKVDSGPGQMN